MSGSRDAKKAWLFLRGPYLLAYIVYAAFVTVSSPVPPSEVWVWWKWSATLLTAMLLFGAVAGWMVVSNKEPKHFWKTAESLEGAALRVLAVVELGYGLIGLTFLTPPFHLNAGFAHIIFGLFFAGIYSNMAWHKIKTKTYSKG